MWEFNVLQPGMTERDPREGEFFRVTNITDVLVREFIQNALDARLGEGVPVRISFKLSHTVPDRDSKYLKGLSEHLKAAGFPEPHSLSSEFLRTICIEDFGTKGLTGSFNASDQRPEVSNYYDFWWREGKSSKKGREAGRWGLGKNTFHLASKIRTFWGYTVRDDDRNELLSGKTSLKTHRIAGKVYLSDGHYVAGKTYSPVSDAPEIASFKETFGISRDAESGLSLVIPFIEPDIDGSSITKATILHYFYPIIQGVLSIDIADGPTTTTIDKDTIVAIASRQNWAETEWENVDIAQLLDFVRKSIDTAKFVEVTPENNGRMSLTADSLSETVEVLREEFNNSTPTLLAFRVKLDTKPKEGSDGRTYYKIYITKQSELKRSEQYIFRSGIRILDHRFNSVRPVRSLLIAEQDAIDSFLGDAETPAHTEWNERTEGFKEKYVNAVSTLRFVRRSVDQLVSLIDEPPTELIRDFLKEIFRLPEGEETQDEVEEMETKRLKSKVGPEKPIEGRQRAFRLEHAQGGFRVTTESSANSFPYTATITMAYDARHGDPMKRYDKLDFDVGGKDFQSDITDGEVLFMSLNKVIVRANGPNFEFKLKGFDERRDLVVRVVGRSNEEKI
ncbi:MAG: hypothetical protein JRN15_10685 [Nitrososphaerota archaeon]|nr:hypothetical protein [Nitrososphaerota archaeon]